MECHIVEEFLNHEFRRSIRVGCAKAISFCERWDIFFSIVYCCTRGENQLFNLVFIHYFKEIDASNDIVVIIEERIIATLSHCFFRSKVNYSVNLFFGKKVIKIIIVSYVSFVEKRLFACEFFDRSEDRFFVGV